MDGETTTRPPMVAVARWLEGRSGLDEVVHAVATPVTGVLANYPGLAGLLHGKPLGHALHPLLTDLPIGLWTGANTLDLVGGPRSREAADLLLGLGILSAVPTVAAGLADWSAAERRVQRVGLVHAAVNGAGTLLYCVSWTLRRRQHRTAGIVVGLVAAGVVTAGSYLGGHLSLRLGAPPGGIVE